MEKLYEKCFCHGCCDKEPIINDALTALESLDSDRIKELEKQLNANCESTAKYFAKDTDEIMKMKGEISRLEKLVEVGRECAKGLIEVSESIQNDSIGEGEHPAKIAERYIEKAKKEGLIG